MVVTEFDVSEIALRRKGIFDMEGMLEAIKEWLEEQYYNYYEPEYSREPDEIEIEIYGTLKLNEYVQYRIDILVRGWELKEVEVVREGKKHKMIDGRIAIDISGTMTLDWQKRFKGNKVMQAAQDFYHRYIIRKTIHDVWLHHLHLKVLELGHVLQDKLEFEAVKEAEKEVEA